MQIIDKGQQNIRKAYLAILALYFVGTAAALGYVLTHGAQVYLVLMAVAGLLLPAVPKLIYKVFKLRPVYLFDIIFIVFAFVAVTFASVLGGYDMVPHLDKILHCASGFLFAVAGMLVYYYYKPGRRKEASDAPVVSMFAAMFAMSSAVLWEIYEYTLSQFGPDPQLVATTGVNDTMQDMIVCTIGGFITAYFCYRYLKHGKKELMMSLFETFYKENIEPRP
ncbi:hypothetical protein [Intestinibacillus massiliensis]|uniref:hypothetical protein n=1 Tax=Intestinibacillus massiliensis TaxID=1871029 RepID=UPI000B36036E|nr:hypothetical protein [Intestinibacillus massiliensis]